MPLGESMLLTLKNNEKIKRFKKKITRPFFGRSTKTESLYHFPEATPEVLEHIRLKMALQNKEEVNYYLLCLVITLLIFVLFIIY